MAGVEVTERSGPGVEAAAFRYSVNRRADFG
jgi:hypothetical protein